MADTGERGGAPSGADEGPLGGGAEKEIHVQSHEQVPVAPERTSRRWALLRPQRAQGRAGRTHAAPILALVLAVVVAPHALASPRTWVVEPKAEGNEVVFYSRAPLESFEGRTRDIRGRITFDPEALGDSLVVSMTVDLASLDTGIALRNQHMRENHLETERFPEAAFTGARLAGFPARLALGGETVRGVAAGQFQIHGITRPLEAQLALTLGPDGTLEVAATFEVRLEDFEIARPKFLMLKLDETQLVEVRLRATPQGVAATSGGGD